ncbi:class I SAM-dependent methyltransferase [Burkholderia mayonis]|uniref:class I SAM-dependent methyltransferase n=1 Tax=Burkholderia mayonis TaxID=1385591 RepID=UPI000AA97D7D|nr:class I SAM-dependent methyltransferase [Burkholderia mayonis]
MKSKEAEQFGELSDLYEDMFEWPFRKHFEAPTVQKIVGNPQNLSIIDFGCGGGGYTRKFKKLGAKHITGYEPTDGMRDDASKRAEQEQLDINYVSELTPKLAGQFDVLLSIYVLPYATSPTQLDAMCTEMASLIRPSGRFIAVTINPDINPAPEYYERYGLRFMPSDPDKSHYSDCSRLTLDLNYRGYEGSVYAWYWGKASIENALNNAGIHSIVWHRLKALEFKSDLDIPGDLRPYHDWPHAIVIEGKKQANSAHIDEGDITRP